MRTNHPIPTNHILFSFCLVETKIPQRNNAQNHLEDIGLCLDIRYNVGCSVAHHHHDTMTLQWERYLLGFLLVLCCWFPLCFSFLPDSVVRWTFLRTHPTPTPTQTPRNQLYAWERSATNGPPQPKPTTTNTTISCSSSSTIISSLPVPRRRQQRRRPRDKRPRNYWSNTSNLELELRQLWKSHHVTWISPSMPPPIPNETLLNYWKRHDLRAAIASLGGRHVVAQQLGDADIIPGKWNLATQTRVVQQVIQHDPYLSITMPPPSPQQIKNKQLRQFRQSTLPLPPNQSHPMTTMMMTTTMINTTTTTTDSSCINTTTNNNNNQTMVDGISSSSKSISTHPQPIKLPSDQLPPTKRWAHQISRKGRGYWNSTHLVIQELYVLFSSSFFFLSFSFRLCLCGCVCRCCVWVLGAHRWWSCRCAIVSVVSTC